MSCSLVPVEKHATSCSTVLAFCKSDLRYCTVVGNNAVKSGTNLNVVMYASLVSCMLKKSFEVGSVTVGEIKFAINVSFWHFQILEVLIKLTEVSTVNLLYNYVHYMLLWALVSCAIQTVYEKSGVWYVPAMLGKPHKSA